MIYFQFWGVLKENHEEGIYGVSKEMLSKVSKPMFLFWPYLGHFLS